MPSMEHPQDTEVAVAGKEARGSPRIAAVILAKNEGRTVGRVVAEATAHVHEVVVLDGRSSDDTVERAREAGATVHADEGRGKGAAVRQSLELVDADILVFLDADGSHDPGDIPKLIAPVVAGEVDLCVGSRFAGGSDELSVNLGQLVRTVGNISMNVAINLRWNARLTDTLNGFRAVRRAAVLEIGLTEDKHTIEQEMVMKMLRHGRRVGNVPTHEYTRKFGASHIDIWREWPTFVRCVISNLVRWDVHSPERRRVSWRPLGLALGVALVALGASLSADWVTPLPRREPLPEPPLSGVTLLRACLALDGLLVFWLCASRIRFRRIGSKDRPSFASTERDSDLHPAAAHLLLLAVTGVAIWLRCMKLGSDLWLDEISPLLDYGAASYPQVVFSYISSNNHLLNTLLVKTMVALLGESEWVVRLPAAGFGIATVPLVYFVGRFALTRRESLGAAFLLAVSYHHVFFSQNARGYTAYIFFSLLSTLLLLRGLRHDRLGIWALYVTAVVLDFASILISGFVFTAQVVIGVAAALAVKRRGGSPLPLLKRLGWVFAASGFLGIQLYAMVIPRAFVYARGVYAGDPAAGFPPLSREFAAEVLRGLSAGLGTIPVAATVPFLAVVVLGLHKLACRAWPLLVALGLPIVLQTSLLLAFGLLMYPRYFVLGLPLALLVGAAGVFGAADAFGERSGRQQMATAGAAAIFCVVALVSARQLSHYYSLPKQAYRAALGFAEERRGRDGMVIVVHLAESGVRYYAQRVGIATEHDYYYVRSVDTLDAAIAANPGRRAVLLTTMPRALRLAFPDLSERITRDWQVVRTFPGSIGDGDISLWSPRAIVDRR